MKTNFRQQIIADTVTDFWWAKELWSHVINGSDTGHFLRLLCILLIITGNFNGSNPDGSLALANPIRAICPGYISYKETFENTK